MNIRKLNTLMILIVQAGLFSRLCFEFESFKYSQKERKKEWAAAHVGGGEQCVISSILYCWLPSQLEISPLFSHFSPFHSNLFY